MKSYANHLKTTRSFGETMPSNYRPTMRSSAVFPVRVEKHDLDTHSLDTIVTFMGYWLLKREIKEVTALLTLRAEDGSSLAVESILVDCVKSFKWSMAELLESSSIDYGNSFFGSIEVEIFSARDMVFPYPAITFSFESPLGISFVHTCGRIYNDIHDLKANDEQQVAETGFDVIASEGYEPFFSFVNGPIPIGVEDITLELINTAGESIKRERKIENIAAYGSAWINVFENQQDRDHFKGERGTVKIHHNLKGFFPRFVAGNSWHDHKAISLTHTYYDTSTDTSETAIWKNPQQDAFHDSVISFPVSSKFDFTELAIYPNFVNHPIDLTFEFFRSDGSLIGNGKETVRAADGEDQVQYIDTANWLDKLGAKEELVLCKVIIDGQGSVPTRMKFGLNMGVSSGINLPSNICFNAAIPNPKLVEKPGTFKWCTVFDAHHQQIFLTNTSFVKNSEQAAKVNIDLWRERDGENLSWEVELAANGAVEIMQDSQKEVSEFLDGETGWITMRADNPFVTGYYVTNFGKGMIGADHVY